VLGNSASLDEESFGSGLLEYPQYTRPEVFRGAAVPPILLSGDHQKIRRWRHEQALERTARRRPDLLKNGRG
jgi:tRNA (guanine37-N1)-methyltransferase